MKDWLIKKLGGFTVKQVDKAVEPWIELVDDYKKLSMDKHQTLLTLKKDLQQTQLELDRLKDWRNNVGKVLRQSKVQRHIVNRVLELPK